MAHAILLARVSLDHFLMLVREHSYLKVFYRDIFAAGNGYYIWRVCAGMQTALLQTEEFRRDLVLDLSVPFLRFLHCPYLFNGEHAGGLLELE